MSEPPRPRHFTRQELAQALQDVDHATADLQQMLQVAPDLIRKFGDAALLPLVLHACDITQNTRKLASVNLSWKVLLTILTGRSVSTEVYISGTLFMVQQLQFGVLSHDWSDARQRKLAAFCASHVVSAVRANPNYILEPLEPNSILPDLVRLYFVISYTIAMSDRPDDEVRPLCDTVQQRLGTILEYLGSAAAALDTEAAAVTSSKTFKDEETISTTTARRLLHHCVSKSAAAQIAEGSGDAASSSMVVSVASLSCVLHASRGLLEGVAQANEAHTLLTLHVLLQWLPSMPQMPPCQKHTNDDATAAAAASADIELLSRVQELAATLPPTALWVTTGAATDRGTDTSPVEGAELRSKWIDCVRDALLGLISASVASGTPFTVPPSKAVPAYISLLSSPHPQNAVLLLAAHQRLCESSALSSAALPHASQNGLRILMRIGIHADTSAVPSLQWESLASLAVLIGFLCTSQRGGGLPSQLCPQFKDSPFVTLADVSYHIMESAGSCTTSQPPLSVPISSNACLDDVQTLLRRLGTGTTHTPSEGDSIPVEVLIDSLRLGPALQHLRLSIEDGTAAGEAKLQAVYRDLASGLAQGTRTLQTAVAVYPIVICVAAAALVEEAAHLHFVAGEDKLKAVIRRWVDLAFEPHNHNHALSTEGALDGILRLHAARRLLKFAQFNTAVGLDELRLSEEAATSLYRLLQQGNEPAEDVSTEGTSAVGTAAADWVAIGCSRQKWWQAASQALPQSPSLRRSGAHTSSGEVVGVNAKQSALATELLTELRRCQQNVESLIRSPGTTSAAAAAASLPSVLALIQEVGQQLTGDWAREGLPAEEEGISNSTTQPLLLSSTTGDSLTVREIVEVD